MHREELEDELDQIHDLMAAGAVDEAQALARELIAKHRARQDEIQRLLARVHRRAAKAYRQGRTNRIPPGGIWYWTPEDARELTE